MGCKGSKSVIKSNKNMDFLLANTNFSEAKINELYDGFIEECHDGKLRKKFLEDTYKEMYQDGDPIDFSHLFFESLDTDKKGYLTFTQFVMALKDLESDIETQYRLLFRVYDMNRNKIIDMNEMIKGIKAVDKIKGIKTKDDKLAKDKAIKVFDYFEKKINTNKTNGLSESEFLKACADKELCSILKP
ncbi:unnamed protein product [Brachionus calyciflorus]|uniref:EF-hand domain-containing protein n=1 Tax=Brachionus calyciflorus TaxID=104777 RepID=A0A814LY46_9BILA|nr:unnamed protein product [Brachionus calyciflorus]